jgi:hypothetical protein
MRRVTVTQVAQQAIGLESARIGTAEQRRIANILKNKGWTAGRDWQGRYYTLPEEHVA